jgi:hypothetical protein
MINDDNSELISDGNDNDSDDEHASIKYNVEPCLLPTTTRIQREIAVDTVQPLHQFTEKLNIQRGVEFHLSTVQSSSLNPFMKSATPVDTPDGMAKFGASVVLHLSQRLYTPGRQIFMDIHDLSNTGFAQTPRA